MKGSVNNDNLPIFGKVKLLIEHVDNATVSDQWFALRAGSSPCNVTFVNTTLIDSGDAGKTEITVPANSYIAAHIDLSGNNISIIIDAYSTVGFQQKHVTDIIGYESLKYGEFISGEYDSNPDDVKKKIVEVLNTKTGIKYLFRIPVSDETIVRNVDTLLALYNSVNPILIKDASNLLICVIKEGNIEYIPSTIKRIELASIATGSFTNLVNKFRAAGRTSGKIYVAWITANNGCTIDNGSGTEIPVSEYVTTHGIPKQMEGYLYWTADTVGITVDGTDAETYPTAWYQAPYV
jgi:hypothetical protein